MSEELKYNPDYIVRATDIIRDAIEVNGFFEPCDGFLENIVKVAFNTRPYNALIDTLVEALEEAVEFFKAEVDEMPLAEQALAEAKKWKDELK
jgi:hypothetical protein